MNPFPEPWELIQLFESEPVLQDPGVPWAYNQLHFSLQRGPDRVEVSIAPGYRELEFQWTREGGTLVALHLHDVVGLAVETDGARELLQVLRSDPAGGRLTIQLSPRVRLTWFNDLTA